MRGRPGAPIIEAMEPVMWLIDLPDLPDLPVWLGPVFKIGKFVVLGVIAVLVLIGELEKRGKAS
jgi:hypothetical protein